MANDNVKRVFGLLHPSLIGRRFTDIFSTSPNQQLPAILYNTLVTPDGHLKEVYGKAVSYCRFLCFEEKKFIFVHINEF